jgi:NAD(P)-dependent dehydrogenase (short-subunit alcohol dehydrogenase family)
MSPHSAATTTNDLVNEYADIIKGKTILTTGVTPNSLGATFILETASKSPLLLILAGRNASKLQEMSETITKTNPSVKTRSLVVDLGSLASVRKAAEEVNGWSDVPSIDVVVNNAGVMAIPYTKSVDGYEMQFAICHLGHFLLTNLIMDKILASESPRVVNISSNGHSLGPIRFADPHFSVSHLSLHIVPY